MGNRRVEDYDAESGLWWWRVGVKNSRPGGFFFFFLTSSPPNSNGKHAAPRDTRNARHREKKSGLTRQRDRRGMELGSSSTYSSPPAHTFGENNHARIANADATDVRFRVLRAYNRLISSSNTRVGGGANNILKVMKIKRGKILQVYLIFLKQNGL